MKELAQILPVRINKQRHARRNAHDNDEQIPIRAANHLAAIPVPHRAAVPFLPVYGYVVDLFLSRIARSLRVTDH